MLYLLSQPDIPFDPQAQEKAVREHKEAALLAVSHELLERGEDILTEMEDFFSDNNDALSIIAYEKQKFEERKVCNTIADKNIFG